MHVTVSQIEGGRLDIEASGCHLIVDRDGPNGEKLGFRPVELLLAALGACTAGTVISFAENQSIDLSGVRIELDSETSSGPERVSKIVMRVEIPGELESGTRDTLSRVAKHCKVHNTLRREPEIVVEMADAPLAATGQPD